MQGYIDFGSQCTLIQESAALKVLDKSKWVYDELPTLKGFGNSVIQPVGVSKGNVSVDGVCLNVDMVIVPDCYLNYEIMLGQTATEQSHIEAYKTDKELHFKSKNICDVERIFLKCASNLIIYGDASIKVICNNDFSGQVFVDRGQRCNYKIKNAYYKINNGVGYITIENIGKQIVRFKQYDLISRAKVVESSTKPINKCFDIKSVSTSYSPIILQDLNIGPLNEDQKNTLLSLVNEYRDCFANDLSELGHTNITVMDIVLKDKDPVVHRPYRLSQVERMEVKTMIDDLLRHNIVRESTSPYASPIIVVKKKTGDKRLCVDYRALNKKTVKQHYPIPRIEDQIDRLSGSKYFSALDLASGYYQIPLTEDAKPKTAFVTPDGQFEFNRMPFGLANAPAVFQRAINMVLGNARFESALAYMDDILIPSESFESGIQKLIIVFNKLRSANLTLKPQKCYFFQDKVEYLGFEVSKEGIQPGLRKTEAVFNFPSPKDVHNVRQFLGLASFFRRFIKGFAEIARPLTKLLKKGAQWIWNSEQEDAFSKLKNALTSRPVLALYNVKSETQIHTDASKAGIGSMLLQKQSDGLFKPVAYYSRQTSPEESHFSSYELETLAVIASLIKFRPYVLGLNFTIVTDCNSLRATFLKRDMIPRVARWWSLIQEYDCDIKYRAGHGMIHVDALSRNPVTGDVGVVKAIENYDVMNIDNDWLATVQSNDTEIRRIKDILSNSDYDDVVEIRKNYVVKRDRVYRNTGDGLRWVVPKGCRWQILQKNHDEIGHFGFDKTYDRIKQHYWFARMRRFIKKYVLACLECAHNKLPAGKKQGYLHPIPKVSTPFHTIHIDHVGPFVTSKKKNTHILAIIDAFSKFIVLRAVKNTKSKTSITVLREYFGIFGLPNRLISDRGTSFTSSSFKDFTNGLGIKHILNAVASPRANGQVERYNRTILDSLAAQNHGNDERVWDDKLLQVQWGLNNTVNKGTGKSPSQILFGLNLTNANEGHLMSEINPDIDENNVQSEESNKIAEIRSEVNEHTATTQNKQKNDFDKKRKKPPQFNIGDLVRVERGPHVVGKSKKLLPKLSGPYRVTQVFDNDRYEVTDTPLTKKGSVTYKGVFAVDKIFPWMCYGNKDSDESSNHDDESDIEELIE